MTRDPHHGTALFSEPFRLPDWVSRKTPETLEEGAFFSGAAIALLGLVQAHPSVPSALWRARLGLTAAANAVVLSGRPERESGLRDILCLLRPGDLPGPAGDIALAWSRATSRPLSDANLTRALPGLSVQQLGLWTREGRGSAVDQAASAMEAVLTEAPRAHVTALVLADAAFARAVGWQHLTPLLGGSLDRRDVKLRGDDLRLACHKAVVKAVGVAAPLAAELMRRAAELQTVSPKLRSKQAAQAVDVFLSRDAVAPATLTPLMSDRAARRLCDRLVSLGVVRELTGRDTFRLYGL